MSWKGPEFETTHCFRSTPSAVLAAFTHPFMFGRADLVNKYSISNIIYGVANLNSMTCHLYPQQLGHIQST